MTSHNGSDAKNNSADFAQVKQNLATQHAQAMQQFKPTFDQIQSLVKAGSKDEAQKVLDNLSDSDYQLYKDTLAVEKRGATSKGEAQFLPTYRQIQSLVNAGKSDEAQQTLDGLSDQEYKYYQLMKKKGL